MASDGLPVAVVGGAAAGMAAAIAALWRALLGARASEREECDRRLAALATRLDAVEARATDAAAAAAAEALAWQDRWRREVERGATLANAPAPALPARPPAPSFEEITEVREARAAIETAAVDRQLQSYLESQRPGPAAPPRGPGSPGPAKPPRPAR